jgi:histidinol-phosphatase
MVEQMTEYTIDKAFLEDCLVTAKRAAKSAEQIIKHYYKCSPDTEIKDDLTPVTQADIECEQVIKQVLETSYPNFGFYGEETGKSNTDSDFMWLVDPIDGTKSFVREYPFFSTQIALIYKGEIIVGVSHAPLFNETAWAAKGLGAFINDQPLCVSDSVKPEECCYSTGNLKSMMQNKKQWEQLRQVMSYCHKTRGYGDFYHYHLLAAGKLELVIESDLNILDIAALTIIIHEAGGLMTDLMGKPIKLETSSVLAGNKSSYENALAIFNA